MYLLDRRANGAQESSFSKHYEILNSSIWVPYLHMHTSGVIISCCSAGAIQRMGYSDSWKKNESFVLSATSAWVFIHDRIADGAYIHFSNTLSPAKLCGEKYDSAFPLKKISVTSLWRHVIFIRLLGSDPILPAEPTRISFVASLSL